MRRALFALTALLVAAVAAPDALASPAQDTGGAAADGPAPPGAADEATRNTARKIAEEGLARFDAGRWAEALDRFQRAGALVRAPTMELMAARSLVKLGRLVEASEHLLAAAQMKLEPDASAAFRAAQAESGKEREALLPRIPTLSLSIGGAADGAEVTLDGKPVSAARLGVAIPLDPGPHTVVVTRDGTTRTERLHLAEGERRSLAVSLDATTRGATTRDAATTNGLQVAGIAGVVIGGVSLVAGAVTGGLALGANSDLAASCPNQKCPPDYADENASYETMKTITTPALVAGAVLAGTGAILIGVAPSSPKRASVTPWIGAASAGVKVVF